MTPEQFRESERAFEAACALESEQREQFLVALAAEDPTVAEAVRRLLAQDSASVEEDLERVVARAAAATARTETGLTGQSVGPYVIDELVAEGGMGMVFKGHRNDAAFEQEVAIKLLSHAIYSEEAHLRFRTERQILANLKHPFIAELYDGGTTGQGLPYLVMEFIHGEPIDVWCDSRQLDLHARLALFLKVCAAVAHAHANLVIHRDIKPSNILIRDDGTPKLLDFGIAKPLDATLAGDAAETKPDARAMTPEYASPEQILGEPVTTATDVYGLGLLLHRLLAGRHPYDVRGKRPSEVETTICESLPTPPSRAVLDAAVAGETDSGDIVRHRATTPRRLARALIGDLDNIVLCALQKKTERRYASVAAFAEDVRRYLDHQPVAARPDSAGYRASRFLRRHWIGAGFSTAFGVLLTGFGVHATLQADALRIERDAAEATTEFLIGMFRLADPRLTEPGYVLPETVTVRELLELGSHRIDELGEQPAVQARLLNAMGMAFQSIGEFDRAAEYFNRALALRESLGEKPAVIAESLAERGWLYFSQSQYRSALAVLTQANGILEELGPDYAVQHHDVLVNLAVVNLSMGELDKADEQFATARKIEKQTGSVADSEIAASLHNQAIVIWERGDFARARAMEERVIEIWERTLHDRHPSLAAAYNFMGTLYQDTGEPYPDAIAYYERALAIDEDQFGHDHPDVARSLMDLAQLNLTMGNLALARARNERALEILSTKFGPQHRDLGIVHTQLADTAQVAGDPALALAHLDAARAAFAGMETTEPMHLALGDLIRARVLLDRGKTDQAARLAGDVAATMRSVSGPDHPRTLEAEVLVGEVALAAGDHDRALGIALAIGKRIQAAGLMQHPVAIGQLNLAEQAAAAAALD